MCETGRRAGLKVFVSSFDVCVECVKVWGKCLFLLYFFVAHVPVWQRMTDGPAGRSRGRWMRWQTETDSPLSLRHNPSFSLPLFSFSACRDDAVPLVLSLGGGEARGKDGGKKKRKNCIHLASMFTSNPRLLLSPPLLLPSASSFIHILRPSSCLSFADQSYSAPLLLLFLSPSLLFGCCFFFNPVPILTISKDAHSCDPPPLIRAFTPKLSASTSAGAHLRFVAGKILHVCVSLFIHAQDSLPQWVNVAEWSINQADGPVLCYAQVPVFWEVLGSWDWTETKSFSLWDTDPLDPYRLIWGPDKQVEGLIVGFFSWFRTQFSNSFTLRYP